MKSDVPWTVDCAKCLMQRSAANGHKIGHGNGAPGRSRAKQTLRVNDYTLSIRKGIRVAFRGSSKGLSGLSQRV